MSASAHALKPATYRISALLRAFLVMWRGWQVLIPVVFINALIQAIISSFPYSPLDSGLNILASVVSALVFVLSLACVVVTAQSALTRRVTWPLVLAELRQYGLRFLLWLIVLCILASLGIALYTWPGIVVLAVTPFVLLASVKGEKNPVAVNFRIVGQRFWRWLITALIIVVMALLGYVILGFTEFFLRGILGGTVIWVIVGVAVAWFFTAWALILNNSQKPAKKK